MRDNDRMSSRPFIRAVAWGGAVCLLATLSLTGPVGAAPAPQPTPVPVLKAGETVPPLEIVGLDGSRRTLSFSEGTTTVLLFFTSACPSCRKMIPEWNRAYGRSPEGLEVVGVILDREPPGFFMATPLSFPVYRSPDRDFLRTHYKLYRVPLTLRVGSGGEVEGVGQGAIDGIRLGELLRPR